MSGVRPVRASPRRRESPRWSAAEWAEYEPFLQARAGGRCECCGRPLVAVERHHRKRRRDGGDCLENLLLLLPACHAHWTAHPSEARERGVIVWTYEDPAMVPVWWRGGLPALLDPTGLVLSVQRGTVLS